MEHGAAATRDTLDESTHALLALYLMGHAGAATLRHCLRAADDDPHRLLTSPNDTPLGELDARDRDFLRSVPVQREQAQDQAGEQFRLAERHHAHIDSYKHPNYPENLRGLVAAPPLLFVRGTLSINDEHSVAIVGSREASLEGQKRAYTLARMLALRDWVVVSGLARGVDTAAHRGALAARGRTVAIVGCGLDRTYPRENAALADHIASSGALISQFPFGAQPSAHHFPMRNKTMALFSLATVVVEAGEQSGAKMQADFALKSAHPKRRVFLMRSLVDAQDPRTGWAPAFIQRGARALGNVDDLVEAIQQNLRVPRGQTVQLALQY